MDKSTLKEKQVHKTDNLEMNVYETGYDIMYHWHDEYEFIYVTDGRCNCIINGEYITINKNELLLIQCGELHTVNVDATAQFFAIVRIFVVQNVLNIFQIILILTGFLQHITQLNQKY